MKTAIIEIGVMILVVTVLTAAIVTSIVVGTGRSEAAECVKWSQEADARPGFYLAQWQKDQCDAHSIFISAPVKG